MSVTVGYLVTVLSLVCVSQTLSVVGLVDAEEDIAGAALVKRSTSYIEDGLYKCHKDEGVKRADDLHNKAQVKLDKIKFVRKRDVEALVEELVTRGTRTVLQKWKYKNASVKNVADSYCAAKDKYLSKDSVTEVGCADRMDGADAIVVCFYRENV